MTTLPSVADILTIPARRKHNRDLALKLAEAGLFIFPSIDKSPCVARWPERAEDIPASEHGAAKFLGSTRDPETIKQMWRAYPDAVPSISCGPSRVLVLDADANKSGPTNLREWAAREGIYLGRFPTTKTQSGGLHIFCKNDAGLGSAAGSFGDMGVDVRGIGGQVVAPGAIRADGRRYTHDEATPNLLAAMRSDIVAPTPEAVKQAISARGQRNESNVVELLPRELERDIEALKTESWPDFAELADAALGGYDLDALAAKDFEFRELRARGDAKGDRTDARFNLAKCLAREWPSMSVCEFAAILGGLSDDEGEKFGVFVDDSTPSQNGGEFNYRNLARDFARGAAQGRKTGRLTDGAALGAVDDDDEDDELRPTDKPKAKKRKLSFELFGDVVQSALDDAELPLIAGMLDEGALSVLYGELNAGKSFVALDMAFHVACGRPWNDRKTTQGLVVYIAAEGGKRFARRVAALRKRYGAEADGAAFALVRSTVDLRSRDRGDGKAIVELVREAEQMIERKAALLVVDTLSRAMAGGDENSSIDMGALVKNCDEIRAATGAHLLLVHHSGKDKAKGARGHSLLRAASDTEIEVVNSKIVTRKQRDMDFAPEIGFALKSVELGVDASGNAQHSAVVTLGAAAPQAERASAAEALKGNQLELFNVIVALAAERAAKTGSPAHAIELPFVEVRERLEARRKADGARELGDGIGL